MFDWLKNTPLYQYHLQQKEVVGDTSQSILHHPFVSGKSSLKLLVTFLLPFWYKHHDLLQHLFTIVAIQIDDSFSFFGSSLSTSQPWSILFLQKLRKCPMNAPCASVTSCIIESDVLHSLTTFYDVKTEVLYS